LGRILCASVLTTVVTFAALSATTNAFIAAAALQGPETIDYRSTRPLGDAARRDFREPVWEGRDGDGRKSAGRAV